MPDEVVQPLDAVFREGRFEDEGESGDRSFAERGIALRGSEAVREVGLRPFCGQPFFAHVPRVVVRSVPTRAIRGGLMEDLLEKVKVLLGKFWQQGVKVFEDCRVSVKS